MGVFEYPNIFNIIKCYIIFYYILYIRIYFINIFVLHLLLSKMVARGIKRTSAEFNAFRTAPVCSVFTFQNLRCGSGQLSSLLTGIRVHIMFS